SSTMSDTPGLLSLYNLLARASNVSCSQGASAFFSLLTTEDDRLSLAIDGFIPALQNTDLQIPQRILAAYALNALYVSHDHSNLFHDHLLRIFHSSQHARNSPQGRSGTQAENEQLVWVLWKILRGESDDLAPYSPMMLSRTSIPDHLQPLHLAVHHGSGHGNISPLSTTQSSVGSMGFPTPQNSTTLFQTGNPAEETSEPHVNERERDELSHAIVLLLSARERVLTLTERRMLQQHLPTLTQPLSLLRPGDIPPLAAKNADIAAKLLLLLLDRKDEDSERIEQAKEGYLDALRKLPPTVQSFYLIASLLRPSHYDSAASAQQEDSPEVRVAALVRSEVLGGFVSGCVRWIESAEQDEKDGEVHDDRVAIAVLNLCRFYSSLLKHDFVSAASEADTAEMMGFALRFSKFENARSLYSTL
ncbi:hypothetical protein JB92DRAFT_2657136, partial [Gautieria morchelliformis]